jgi:hypothetical protein
MQNGNSDKIQQLIEAARAEERAKLAVEAILKEINERLISLERLGLRLESDVHRLKGATDSNYVNINTLIQLMAATWKGDKSDLFKIQQKLAEQAFLQKEKEEGRISVKATGDVHLSADQVGRDKTDGKE